MNKFPNLEEQLIRAIEAGDLVQIKKLIERGADPFKPVALLGLSEDSQQSVNDLILHRTPPTGGK